MLKNAVIIIPSISDESQTCDFLVQTARILKNNNRVYVLPYFTIPRLLPLRRFVWIEQLNRILYFTFLQFFLRIKHRHAANFYWWIFFPQLVLISHIKMFGWQVVFDIVDYHSHPVQSLRKKLEEDKNTLLSRANHIFSISHAIKKLYQPTTAKEIMVVPQGCALQELASEVKHGLKIPTNKPIIGFVGQISERIDFALLEELIAANPQWNFVFIGPVRHESNVAITPEKALFGGITKYQNFFHYSSQQRSVLLSVMKKFDICIIPYDIRHDFNRYCYPMKLFEYFYAGKPVVSTSIEELKRFHGLVYLADDASEFALQIRKLLKREWTLKKINQQRTLALENSWENKLNQMSQLIK